MIVKKTLNSTFHYVHVQMCSQVIGKQWLWHENKENIIIYIDLVINIHLHVY